MQNFNELQLHDDLNKSLAAMNFSTPTPIQAQAIPLALEGFDILGSAQTGTGKTGAFGIPMVQHVLDNPESMAIVLTPTRELAGQVAKVIQQLLGFKSPVKTAVLIGGDSMGKQIGQLKCKPRIIIGTPGRVNDHLQRRTLRLDQADMLVLDETDRMLDMGFGVQIDAILKFMPGERQTLMFSATMPKEIVTMSQRYMKMPKRISMGSSTNVADDIEQELVRISDAGKYNELLSQLEKRDGSIIVFVKTKYGAEKLAKKLVAENHSANAIHGDLRQHQRERVINAFRNKRHRIMVATDVAARGLDIPHIEHVINFDLPQCPEDYIHRIGRTARAGAKGCAVSLLAPTDSKKWAAIYRMMNPNEKPQREERPRREGGGGRSQGKPYSNSNSKGKSFGDKKRFGDKKPYGKSFGDKKPYGDKREGGEAKPYGEKKAFGDKKPYGKTFGDKPYGDKPYGEKREGGESKPYGEKKSFGDRGAPEKKAFGASHRFDNKPKKFKSDSRDESRGEPRGESRGEYRGEKRTDTRSENRSEPRGENKTGKIFGKKYGKPAGNKPQGGKPGFQKPFRKGGKPDGSKNQSRHAA